MVYGFENSSRQAVLPYQVISLLNFRRGKIEVRADGHWILIGFHSKNRFLFQYDCAGFALKFVGKSFRTSEICEV
jgi:hypothetical protein